MLLTDVCLCEYTAHGHCGVIVAREVDNDATLDAAYWISDAFPFARWVRFFASALYDRSPWEVIGHETAWLVELGAVFLALARSAARRLAA